MHINYQLTKQDYIDFNIFHMSYSNTIRQALFIQRYIISIVFLIAPFIVAKVTDIPLWYWAIAFIVIYLLWIIFYPKYFRWSAARRISRMIDEGKNADMLGNQSLTLTEDAIVNISNFSESKTNWHTVENVVETKEHIFIYISAVMAYIIPIRIFESVNQKNEFSCTLNYFTDKNNAKNKAES